MKFLKIRECVKGQAVNGPSVVLKEMETESKIDRECFWVLHLNSQSEIIDKEMVSMGTLNCSLIHPRETMRRAIINSSAALITVHNHPSGNNQPSNEDRAVMDRLNKVGELLGIEFLDHLIITPNGKYWSAKESGF